MSVITDTMLDQSDETELLTLTLHTSHDGQNWATVVFEGESPTFVDKQARAYLAEQPAGMILIDENSTRWHLFPRTFQALLGEQAQTVPAGSMTGVHL